MPHRSSAANRGVAADVGVVVSTTWCSSGRPQPPRGGPSAGAAGSGDEARKLVNLYRQATILPPSFLLWLSTSRTVLPQRVQYFQDRSLTGRLCPPLTPPRRRVTSTPSGWCRNALSLASVTTASQPPGVTVSPCKRKQETPTTAACHPVNWRRERARHLRLLRHRRRDRPCRCHRGMARRHRLPALRR